MPASRSLANLTPGNRKAQPCTACLETAATGTRGAFLHSCDSFPLPSWTRAYLDAFERGLSGESSGYGNASEILAAVLADA